ncbi:unnamed protein product, partial [Didymodactylos carnosus]
MNSVVMPLVVDVYAKPDKIDHVKQVLFDLIEPTRKSEGCMKYRLYENVVDAAHFTIVTQWASEDAYEDHLQSDYVKKATELLKDDFSKPADVKKYKHVHLDQGSNKKTKNS